MSVGHKAGPGPGPATPKKLEAKPKNLCTGQLFHHAERRLLILIAQNTL